MVLTVNVRKASANVQRKLAPSVTAKIARVAQTASVRKENASVQRLLVQFAMEKTAAVAQTVSARKESASVVLHLQDQAENG